MFYKQGMMLCKEWSDAKQKNWSKFLGFSPWFHFMMTYMLIFHHYWVSILPDLADAFELADLQQECLLLGCYWFVTWGIHCMCFSILSVICSMCFQEIESPVSPFWQFGFDLWQYVAFMNSPHKVFLFLKLHHCLYWKSIQTSCMLLIPTPPSSYGKLIQWYLILSFLLPQKRLVMSIWIYLKIVESGIFRERMWMGSDCKTCLIWNCSASIT